MSSEIWNPRSSASAEQPPDDLEDNSSFDGESTMAPLATHELSLSAQQPAVLQCLDREGWLVTPPVNGCRVAVLSRACKQALEGWPHRLECLEFLEIESDAFVARQLEWVAHHCPNLRYLVLDTTFASGDNLRDAIQAIARGNLFISDAIQAIARGCSQLRHLDVSTNSVSDEAIAAVIQFCPQLQHLDVSACDVTDATLWAVAADCPQLKELDVALNRVSNTAIQAVAADCPQLRRLNVAKCTDRTDEAIESVAWGCPQLERLYVACLQLLTDAAIQAVAQGCPQLKELNVSRCARLTDASIRSLAESCTQLESLTTRYCPLLTSAVVRALEQGCRQLKYLDMTPLVCSDGWRAMSWRNMDGGLCRDTVLDGLL